MTLNAEGIDRLSALLAQSLVAAGTDHNDIVRLRLAIEDILMLWRNRLGEGARSVFRRGSRLGRMYIEIQVPGERLEPLEIGEEADGLLYLTLLAQAGLSPVYSYRDGQNRLELYPPKPQRMNPLIQLVLALAAALRLKVSYPMLLRKLLPTYLIALATASSSAALSTNLETCEKTLGISERISRFAVPLGQVVFETGAGAGIFVLAMGLAEYYDVAISFPWVVAGVLTAGLLAIAAPPVPGSSLTGLYGAAGPAGDSRAGGRSGDCGEWDTGFFYNVLRDFLPAVGAAAGGKPAGAFR